MRLDRYISHSAGLTRKESQTLIRRGLVSVDGNVVKDAGFHVDENRNVTINDEEVAAPRPRYLMLHKPKGYVCALEDRTHASVLSLLDVHHADRLHVAGRLDADTTGLVLITDDGEWSHRVTSPRYECEKTYRVTLSQPIDDRQIEEIIQGIPLRGETKPCKPARVVVTAPTEIELTITEGKYHQVKRMLAAAGNHVLELHRERIGHVVLDPNLEEGEWRELTEPEITGF